MTHARSEPVFRDLSREECEAILARNQVGRLAFSLHDRVDVQPLHYVYEDGWIYGRTSEGAKLERVERNRWIAFEVDEVDGVFDWRSVVVHGGFYIMDENGREDDRALREKAVRLLRRIVPATGREQDPVAFRDVYFRVPLQEVTGRECRSRA